MAKTIEWELYEIHAIKHVEEKVWENFWRNQRQRELQNSVDTITQCYHLTRHRKQDIFVVNEKEITYVIIDIAYPISKKINLTEEY